MTTYAAMPNDLLMYLLESTHTKNPSFIDDNGVIFYCIIRNYICDCLNDDCLHLVVVYY